MQNNIEIKFLSHCMEHIPRLAKLWFEEISQHWVPDASIERNQQKLIEHANLDKLPLTLVALENNQPVGMASSRVNDGIRPELLPWLGSLVVDPNYRQRKIGEKLINSIKQYAVHLQHKELYLLAFDKTIPHWYERLGWKTIGMDYLVIQSR